MELQSDMEIKEACGVFGIFNPNGEDAASSIYYGLCSLQHRGQESCGIAVCDTKGPKGNMNTHKGMGHTQDLRCELEQTGAIFHTTTDSEVIAYCIARERVRTHNVEEAILHTAKKIRGAYGLVIASPRKLIGVRDPLGLKPLCLGKRDSSYIIASESCALSAIGAEFIRDIRPGEILTITADGITSNCQLCQETYYPC